MDERSVWVLWGLRLALLAAGIFVLAVLANRFGIVHFRYALLGLAGGAVAGLLAVLLGLAGLLDTVVGARQGFGMALVSIVLGAVAVAPVANAIRVGAGVPRIHDISTDLEDVPVFVNVRALRTPAHNALDRTQPPDLAAQQRAAYPRLGPLVLDRPAGRAFEQAVALVQERGWDVVSVSAAEGVIEATHTTPLMGFRDDVVIRVRERENRSLVDMRSVSRVGESDLGTNAARIEVFLQELAAIKPET